MEEEKKELGMHLGARKIIFKYAKVLRRKMTDSEALLWEHLNKKQLEGRKFRRQHPIGKYIVDFYCHSENLVIEIDGAYHFSKEQQEKDRMRTVDLEMVGLAVVRFTNQEIEENIDEVLKIIKNKFSQKRRDELPL